MKKLLRGKGTVQMGGRALWVELAGERERSSMARRRPGDSGPGFVLIGPLVTARPWARAAIGQREHLPIGWTRQDGDDTCLPGLVALEGTVHRLIVAEIVGDEIGGDEQEDDIGVFERLSLFLFLLRSRQDRRRDHVEMSPFRWRGFNLVSRARISDPSSGAGEAARKMVAGLTGDDGVGMGGTGTSFSNGFRGIVP